MNTNLFEYNLYIINMFDKQLLFHTFSVSIQLQFSVSRYLHNQIICNECFFIRYKSFVNQNGYSTTVGRFIITFNKRLEKKNIRPFE